MFVRKEEYESLLAFKDGYNKLFEEVQQQRDIQELNQKLEEEIQRLADLIATQTTDCKMGPWCKDCKHLGQDESSIIRWDDDCRYYRRVAAGGQVQYCKKHLHEICPEFEMPEVIYARP